MARPITMPASEYWPTSGECPVSTSYARVAMMPLSSVGSHPICTAWTVETTTGSPAAAPAATVSGHPAERARPLRVDATRQQHGTGVAVRRREPSPDG